MLDQINYTASRTKLKLSAGAYTCAGIKENNEDAYAIDSPDSPSRSTKGIVAVIADGVSHAKQAQKASQYCCQYFSSRYYDAPKTWATSRIISDVIKQINNELCDKKEPSITNQEILATSIKPQWLTTFSGILFKSASAHIFHVGDSQILLLRNGRLKQLTTPHNQKLANNNSILTRAIGADKHIKIDYKTQELEIGDIFLLTTDGVHDVISEEVILENCKQQKDLNQLARQLVSLAKDNASQDNMSCLAIKVDSVPLLDPDEIRKTLLEKAIPPALKEGQRIEGFTVIRNLHSSSRSHLYLVEERNTKKTFTLKIPSINFSDDEIYLQGFIREAWVGSQITHPAIMKVYPAKTDSKFLYHICEYIDGQTLRQWMFDHPKPSLQQVRHIVSQVVEALRVFKRFDIVHRDIKPENIMINEQDKIKLVDYGTASIAALEEQVNRIVETHPLGTVNYVAPETLINLTSDHRSDLFSLGVMTYEMLTGILPYPTATSQRSKNNTYSNWHYQSAKEQRKDLPFWLDLALRKSVEANPLDRYDLYSEFLTDISKPNSGSESSFENRPFIEKDPVKFWKLVSTILTITLVISLLN